MASFDWKKIVGTVAPGLATALGGPLAGVAVQALSAALLGKQDGTEAELAAAITTGGSDALLKIKEADNAFLLKLAELDVDIEKVNAGDRADARRREIDAHDSWTPRFLAATVVLGFMYMVYMMISGSATEQLSNPVISGVVGTLIGYVSSKADTVVTYYFGSSASSRAKDIMLGKKL
jgi:hypothetical protein